MSLWCPECNRINYNKLKCDFCGHVIEDASKSYKISKPQKVKILKPQSQPILKKDTASYMDVFKKIVHNLFTPDDTLTTKKSKTTYHDKKSRGDEYEEYIANHYRQLGCDVIEHGKEKGLKDGGIDLIAKLGNEVILIQCKDWNENHSYKIDHKDIKVLRTDANDFLSKNPIYKDCEIKLRYTLSGNFLHKSAEKYIQECNDDISYEIIKPPYRKLEDIQPKKIKKRYKLNKKVEGTYIEKMIIGFIVIILVLFIFKPSYKTETINNSNANKNIIMLKNTNKGKQTKSKIVVQEIQRNNTKKYNTQTKQYSNYQNFSKTQIQKSEREKAKEMLLIQMKN